MRHRRRRRSCLEKSELLFVATTPLHLWLLFHWLLRPTCHKNAARILFDVRKELKVTAQVQSSNMEGVHSCRDPAIVAIASWRIKLNEGHCWHAGHMLQRLYQIVQVACSPWTSERIRKCSTGAGSTRLAAQRRAEIQKRRHKGTRATRSYYPLDHSEMNQLLLIRSLKLLCARLSLQPTLRKDKNKNPTCPRAWQRSQCPFWFCLRGSGGWVVGWACLTRVSPHGFCGLSMLEFRIGWLPVLARTIWPFSTFWLGSCTPLIPSICNMRCSTLKVSWFHFSLGLSHRVQKTKQ